ncbi:MAG TPA: hypothetical protein GXX51_07920 [Firmicutes bacterium]|nr:hypothetical protein [Bacillota bacterium]
MSLMGIDVGTSGCKVAIFSESGDLLARAYREYDIIVRHPGWNELDSIDVWNKVKSAIREAASTLKDRRPKDPVRALSVSSFGEAMTPVSEDRRVLDNCILGLDCRGQEYVEPFAEKVGVRHFFEVNGNILGHMYSMPKLQWIRDHKPDLFDRAYKFLLWQDLIYFLMGCEAVTDCSLAGRTLLYDIKGKGWSDELTKAASIPVEKLPRVSPAGTDLGPISDAIADELGLPRGTRAVVGGHDQCCTALGAGVIRPGVAVYGIGTFACITPAFSTLPDSALMMRNKMGIEAHVVPGLYVSFLYNGTGGSVLKWFRDMLARAEKAQAEAAGVDIYDKLMAELPEGPSRTMVLPHFTVTGPPLLESRTSGVIAGLTLETTRGELVKGLLEGVTYYLREGVELLEEAGIHIDEYRPTGGGAKSRAWLQVASDIMGKPLAKPRVVEAGAFGAAILAGVGTGIFDSATGAADELVKIERVYEPDAARCEIYQRRMDLYRRMYPALREFLRDLSILV